MRFFDMYKAIAVAAVGAMFCVQGGVMAQIDCLPDGGSCQASVFCPATCCTGVPMRTNGPFRHCPKNILGPDTPSTPSKSSVTIVPSPSPTMVPSDDNDASPSSRHDDPAPATPAANATPKPATPPANNNIPPANPVPSPTPKKNDVESFDSRNSNISGSRSSASGGAFPIAIAGVGCCVVLVGAVLYKRRMQPDTSELPSTTTSGYQGPNEGTTPDNRSLDGMLAAGTKRSSVTDSMKQLPVLSIASRQDGGSFSRASSPFGHDKARISSPAQSRSSQDDMAFRVEGGSSVHVNFAPQNSELSTADKDGIVAL
ncbi:hypothetical protein PINS_up011279 [Pythium insidiosum]|nr:hypothetical protein PINS_up011279 [Pythium insidiosum]